jgi:hypothetical protein
MMRLRVGELWKAFRCCGKVKDVFIPSKRNKDDQRFGFVRFAADGLREDFLMKLDQIWVHSTKLKVHASKFERELEGTMRQTVVSPVRIQRPAVANCSQWVPDGDSFVAAVNASPMVQPGQELIEVSYDIPLGRIDELKESVVGLLQPNLNVQQIREQLIVAGMANIMIASMGGNQILIQGAIGGCLGS